MKMIQFEVLVQRLPRTKQGKLKHRSVLYRWHHDGIIGRDGQRVFLKAAKVGGRWCSSQAWLAEFIAGTNGQAVPAIVSPGDEERRVDRLVKELEAKGIR